MAAPRPLVAPVTRTRMPFSWLLSLMGADVALDTRPAPAGRPGAPRAPADEPAELGRLVVVVRGRAHQALQPAALEVEAAVGAGRERHVDALGHERGHDVRGRPPRDGERHDRAALLPEVVRADARDAVELLAQVRRQRVDALPDRFEAPPERVVDRDAEADLRRVVRLPVLEPAGVAPDAIGAARLPPLR